MSIKRVLQILMKDLRLAPRSPMLLFAIIMPFLITFLIQVVFGSLFEPKPRLGIVDLGKSEIVSQAQNLVGIEVVILDEIDILKKKVEVNDLDVGFILEENFDQKVLLRQRPNLDFFISGESLASERIILSVTTIDLIRKIENIDSPVDIEIITLGEEILPMTERLVPLILFYVLFMAGVFVPAMSIVQEKEERTINAILATPTKISEVILAKAILGFMLAILMTFITLILNNALGSEPLALILSLFVAMVMISQVGIIFATISKDAKTLFTLIKSSGILLFAPAIFYIWTDLPIWIAKIFPTYWMINPIYRIGIENAGLSEIWFDLVISVLICIAFLPLVIFLVRKMERGLAL